MNRKQRKLMMDFKAAFESGTALEFKRPKDSKIIHTYLTILNNFSGAVKTTKNQQFGITGIFYNPVADPFSEAGKKAFGDNWYYRLKQTATYQIIRDLAAFIGLIASILIPLLAFFYSRSG